MRIAILFVVSLAIAALGVFGVTSGSVILAILGVISLFIAGILLFVGVKVLKDPQGFAQSVMSKRNDLQNRDNT